MIRCFLWVFGVVALGFLPGCIVSGTTQYVPPTDTGSIDNVAIVERPKEDVWAQLVSRLSENFFEIQTMDETSGLVSLGYDGHPLGCVDCGVETYEVTDPFGGTREATVRKAQGHQFFEQECGGVIYNVTEEMDLTCVINVLVQEMAPGKTRVSVNAQYTLDQAVRSEDPSHRSTYYRDQTVFTTHEAGRLGRLRCRATGELEGKVLQMLTS